jgi:transposase-like protein
MITMEMLGKVRRMHLRDKLSLHEISKRTGLARNTLRKWVRQPEADVAPPRYRREEMPTKLGAFHAALELALKAGRCLRKSRRRATRAATAGSPISSAIGMDVKSMRRVHSFRSVSSKARRSNSTGARRARCAGSA